MSQSSIKIDCQEFDTSTLTVDNQAVNPDGFMGPCSILHITNGSDNNIGLAISFDGGGTLTLFDPIVANKDIMLNFQTNAGPKGYAAMLPKGAIIYAASGTSNAGVLVLSCYYQAQ